MTIAEIRDSVRHGLRNLLHFSGREPRASFWPYAIFSWVALALLAFLLARRGDEGPNRFGPAPPV